MMKTELKTIFVIDDSEVNLTKVKHALEGGYRVLTFISALRMFSVIKKITPDLILLDIEMPEMDGFQTLRELKKNDKTAQIPIIFLTASSDEATEVRCLEMGAVDFIMKPFSAPIMLNRIDNHLDVSELIKKRTRRIQELLNSFIYVLADMVESRDKVTSGHVDRTSGYIEILIDAMQACGLYKEQMQDWDKETLVYSARLHDIGKVTISDVILNKPGKLTPEEFEIMKTHSSEGQRIIEQMIERTGDETFLFHAKFFAGYHHERWDGRGYNHGIAGEEIPLQGRIMAIVDVYDALVSERPYKKPFSHEDAVNIIMGDSGKQFDPKIAEVFFTVKDKFKSMKESRP
jgi:putative two-component system response regulator